MSLRFMSRFMYQLGSRGVQGMKDQLSKCDATLRSLKDSTFGGGAASSSSRQARKFTGALDSAAFKAAAQSEKLKQAEESLRTVMYLSCWGPN